MKGRRNMLYSGKSSKNYLILFPLLLALLIIETGCAQRRDGAVTSPQEALKPVGWSRGPRFKDESDKLPLLAAIRKNYDYLGRLPSDRMIKYGNREYSVAQITESFQAFETILKYAKDENELNRLVTEHFDIFQSAGIDQERNVLFTGYYEPIMKGSFKRSSKYRYPVYSHPKDLIKIDLGKFHSDLKGRRIIARVGKRKVIPYYTREEIYNDNALRGKGLEIAWLESRLDLFFLHIQGSGIVETESGKVININYAGSNGHAYRSIGRLLIKNGDVPKEEMSMKAIRDFLNKYPEKMDEILHHNKSYVFFRLVKEGPIGSTGVTLTPKRSIATDRNIFPKGGLAYIETELPITDKDGSIKNWEPFSAFVVDQDTGGAIKGSGRVDIFCGSGDEPGHTAGNMNRAGKLFYLIKKGL